MSNRLLGWGIGALGGICIVLDPFLPSYSQSVIPDDTVGTTVIGNGPFTVTGGTQQLTTLFHSFQDFSPNTADVLFQLNAPQDAVNVVIGRVTGTNTSVIDGQLQLTGGNNPDLFLINPNGITFGNNANLLLPGSFFVSTAESVLFDGARAFSSRNPEPAPLLTVSAPMGLRFGAMAHGITVAQSNLLVNPGETLGFLGGDLQFLGSTIDAEAGHLLLGSVAPGSQVAIENSSESSFPQLDYANATSFQDILLTQGTTADVSGGGGGRFQVQGRVFKLLDDSVLIATNTGSTDGGIVSVRASERIEIVGTGDAFSTFIFADAFDAGQGNQLLLETDQLRISDAALVTTDNFGSGAGGGITINADDVFIIGSSDGDADSTVLAAVTGGPGQGGNIAITADRLIIQDTGQLAVDALDTGTGGNVLLQVSQLSLQNGAQAATATFGEGDAGDFTVIATDAVEIAGFNTFSEGPFSSGLFASAEPGSTGNAGNISITTPRLSLLDGGKVAVNTVGEGDGGNIIIRADEIDVADPIIDFTGAVSGLVANVVSDSGGSGGSLDIEANRFRVYNGGQITASTNGIGNAGTVTIRADEVDVWGQSRDGLFNSAIMSGATTQANAGSVNLQGQQIAIRDGAQVSVSSLGGGDAGDLNISAETLFLNNGTLQAKVTAGDKGDLNISASQLILLRQNSQIITSASGMSTGGNITLMAPVILGIDNSDIVANAVLGTGGNIDITTQSLLGLVFRDRLTPANDITASSEFGVSGTIAIDDFGVDPDSGLVELPSGLAVASDRVVQGCTAGENQFVVTGRGGIPVAPTDGLNRDRTWADTRDLTPFLADSLVSSSPQPSPQMSASLAEATTWQTNGTGQVELIATAGSVPFNPVTCADRSL